MSEQAVDPAVDPAVDQAVQRLQDAAAHRSPCPPVRDVLTSGDVAHDVDTAYAVQHRLISARTQAGARVVGRKIGLTNPAVQRQLKVDQPDFGVLLEDMARPDGGTIDVGDVLQPRIEAELAFVLRSDLTFSPVTPEAVRAATGQVVAALEIVDSRVAGWDITIVDTVADNASSGLFVVGEQPVDLADLDTTSIAMTMSQDGEVVSTGTGADCLGDPVAAVVWLAETALRYGDPLRAGDVVLSGALGPMVPVRPGSTYAAQITSVGAVSTSFSTGSDTASDTGSDTGFDTDSDTDSDDGSTSGGTP